MTRAGSQVSWGLSLRAKAPIRMGCDPAQPRAYEKGDPGLMSSSTMESQLFTLASHLPAQRKKLSSSSSALATQPQTRARGAVTGKEEREKKDFPNLLRHEPPTLTLGTFPEVLWKIRYTLWASWRLHTHIHTMHTHMRTHIHTNLK